MVIAVAREHETTLVKRLQRRAMPDRDDGGVGQTLAQEQVKRSLRRFIERCRGLIQKKKIGRMENRARDAETLLLAKREHAVPVRLLIEALRKLG